MNVYDLCPELVSTHFTLRLVEMADAPALLQVYSDPAALPLFNADNCHYGAFHMETLAAMEGCIRAWLAEYEQGHFARWTVLDGAEPVGTVELFKRIAGDDFGHHGLLRLDLRSDYEREAVLSELFSLLSAHAYALFDCDALATKAVPAATERCRALEKCGFMLSAGRLIGHDGTRYGDYWVREKGS